MTLPPKRTEEVIRAKNFEVLPTQNAPGLCLQTTSNVKGKFWWNKTTGTGILVRSNLALLQDNKTLFGLSPKKLSFYPKVRFRRDLCRTQILGCRGGVDNQKFVSSVSFRHKFVHLCFLCCVFCVFGNDPISARPRINPRMYLFMCW